MHFTHEDEKLIARDTRAYLEANPGAEVVGDNLELPKSRRFRDAWQHDGVKVAPHVDKARAQVMAEVRAKRDAELAATDGEFMKSLEKGVKNEALEAKRQALRDRPTKVEAEIANLTADELEQYAV
jgi:hypothetical protein